MTYPIPKPREKSRWLNLSQGSLPLALARYLPHKRLKVVLTQDAEQALRLQTAWRFFRPHDTAVFLPDWETLPYERFSPHQDLVSERLSALWQIKSGAADVLFVPVATAMQKLPPVPFLAGRTFWLKTGQTLDIGRLKSDLVDAGYNHVSHVVAAGEFAVRGGIVDLFPMGSEMPYRIDLFDDEIDSIKTFDTDTQRTISPVSEIRLLPAHEFPTDSEAQKIFRSRFREEVDGNPNDAAVYKAVSNGHFGAGVEYYLPLFFENELETLFDYIGEDALFVSLGDVHAEANRFWSDVKSRYAMAQGDETYPPLLPQYLYLSADVFAGRLKNYGQVLPDVSGKEHALPDLAVNRQADEPLQALKDFQTTFDGRILLCAESLGRRETMLGFLQQNGLKTKPVSDWRGFLSAHEPLMITVAPLAYGFKLGGLQSPSQQQPTPDSEREGKTVAAQTEFSTAATSPLPSPLPQEREQNAAAVSDDLKTKSSLHPIASDLHRQIQQQPAPPPPRGGGGGGGRGGGVKTSRSDNTVTATSFDAGQPPVTDKNAGHKKPRSQNPGEKTIHWYPTPDADLYRALIAPYQPYLEKLQDAGANPQELLNTYDQYRILCAGHHGALGTRRINAALRQLHQRAQGADTSLAYYHGLPLMILENDHRQQLYNGDTGICLEDDNGLQLHLPGHEPVPLARLNPATLADAYALSIHKSQGSEYPHVALALDEHAERLLSRELLYTGITRSKGRLDIYASADALKNAAATPTRRHTGLAWHLDHPHKTQTNH